jgi:FkbM family methyltransferase
MLWIVAAALATVIIVALLTFVRRLRNILSSISEQLAEIRALLADADRLRSEEAIASNLRAIEIGRQLHGAAEQFTAIREQFASIREQVETLNGQSNIISVHINELSADVSTLLQLPGLATDLSAKIAALEDVVDLDLRTPFQSSPVDSAPLETRTDAEVLALAEPLVILRPLVPYPKWRFDADLANPDLSFQLRQRIWQYWHDRGVEASLIVPWHAGTRLQLILGNDLSRQIFVAGCIDPNEFAFLDRFLQPGMTFLDAGANEGIYTVFAAKRVGSQGTVWAFEPSGRELERLHRNLELNHSPARVFPLALADFSGQSNLTIANDQHAGQNTLGALTYDGVEALRTDRIDVTRLDTLVEQNPLSRLDVFKIDVEGAELRLLRGAVATLRRFRPIIIFELCHASLQHQGSTAKELVDFFQSEEYALYLLDPHTGLPAKAPPGASGANMIAVPEETSLPDSVYRPWPHACQ